MREKATAKVLTDVDTKSSPSVTAPTAAEEPESLKAIFTPLVVKTVVAVEPRRANILVPLPDCEVVMPVFKVQGVL